MSNTARSQRIEYSTTPDIRRDDFTVESESGIHIFVRSLRAPETREFRTPVILLHGARASSIPSFDLDVAGGSLAADLARSGHPVYLMDARGYGGSTRPSAMSRPPHESEPLARSTDVIRDIGAVVEHVRYVQDVPRTALMGWATGSQWLAHYAATHPETVSHLILYNSVWPVAGNWSLGDNLDDPENPGELKPGVLAGYGFATADALRGRWDSSIPTIDPDQWRNPAVLEAYLQTAISFDPSAGERSPASLRTPLGALADTFELTRGKPLFDPANITARVLILRSELDFWSREIDIEAPLEDLSAAESVQREVIPNATHFAHLDRDESGRRFLIDTVRDFLSGS